MARSKKKKRNLFSPADKKFLAGGILTLSLLFTLLHSNYQGSVSNNRNKPIGTLTVKKNVVHRKSEGQVLWESMKRSYPVYKKDTIRTGGDSAAVLHIHGKFKIDMDGNTLISLDVLETSQKERVHLNSGSARFRPDETVKGKSLSLEFVNRGQIYHLNGPGPLVMSRAKTNGKLQVAALDKGSELLDSSGQGEILTPDTLLILSEGKISKRKLAIVAQEPKDGATYLANFGGSISVNFNWKSKSENQKVQIKISKYSDLSNPLLSRKVKKSSFTTRLKPGLYYWRLSDSEDQYSITQKFRVISQVAVKTKKPLDNSVFSYSTIKPFINFSWNRAPESSVYRLEVAEDETFESPLITKDTLSINYVSNLPQGKYYWRVTAKSNLTNSGISSLIKSFTIVRQKKIATPLLSNLPPDQLFDKKSIAKKGFVLNWKDNPEIAYTEVIVAENRNFSKIVIKKKVFRNFYSIKEKFSKPVYYYKLKFYNKKGELIADSTTQSFKVGKKKVTPPLPFKPSPRQTLDEESLAKNGFIFRWRSPPQATHTEIVIAEDKNFSQAVLKIKASGSSHRIKAKLSKSLYYYKLNAFDEQGELIANSTTQSFKVKKEKITPPVPFNPSPGQILYKKSLAKNGFIFRWKSPPQATHTEIVIAKNKNFSQAVLKTIASGSSHHIKAKLPKAIYYYKLNAIDEQGELLASSTPQPFKVRSKGIAPLLSLKPSLGQTLDKKSLAKKGFVFRWESPPQTTHTEIVIAENKNFSQAVLKTKASGSSHRIKAKLPKLLYYYKLNAFDEQGEIFASSPVLFFKLIEEVKIKLTYPKKNSSIALREVLKDGLLFSWQKPEVEATFEVVLAKRHDLVKPILKQKVEGYTLTTKSIREEGAYFCRITTLDAEDGSVLSTTEVIPFVIMKLSTIEIKGMGEVYGRIISQGKDTMKISTPQGVIMVNPNKIMGIRR